MNSDILIVDDEEDIRTLIQGILEDEGYKTRIAANSSNAYAAFETKMPNLVILDIWLQGSEHDGIEILKNIKEKYPYVPVIMISGHGTIETAVSSIQLGAYDFIEKPFKSDRLLLMITRALETAQLKQENDALKQKVDQSYNFIGSSQTTKNFLQIIKRAAPTNSRVLFTGEPGAGKELAAKLLHDYSSRKGESFLVLSCANLRPDRLEKELFGSEDGVMGESAHTGILEKANGGTLLLDEVADMPLETQAKIVRVLQNQSFQKVGGNKAIEVDVRIIASTNKNLEEEIKQGNFREDLFYRLNVVPIRVPPLRERDQDIAQIAQYYLSTLSKSFGINENSFSKDALMAMESYNWPGNIRQLRNTIEWVMIMNGNISGTYGEECLPPEITGKTPTSGSPDNDKLSEMPKELAKLPLREAREHFEKIYLQKQIDRFDGNVSKTANFIGMERSALHRKLKSLGIMSANEKDENDVSDINKKKRA